jgi:hypothetical protein
MCFGIVIARETSVFGMQNHVKQSCSGGTSTCAGSPDFAGFLSACAPVIRILRTLCPRARPFRGFCGLSVRVRARSVDFADFLSACAPVPWILRTFCPRARPFRGFWEAKPRKTIALGRQNHVKTSAFGRQNHVKQTLAGGKIT